MATKKKNFKADDDRNHRISSAQKGGTVAKTRSSTEDQSYNIFTILRERRTGRTTLKMIALLIKTLFIK